MTRRAPAVASILVLAGGLGAACTCAPSMDVRFTDVTPSPLPAGLPPTSSNPDSTIDSVALLDDVDGDGSTELLVSAQVGGAVFRWQEDRFVPAEYWAWEPRMPMLATADLDEDGRAEVLGGPQVLFYKPGAPLAIDAPRWSWIANLAIADVDGDGWLDVTGASPCCREDCDALGVFVRTGPRSWQRLKDTGPKMRSYLATWLPLQPGPYLLHFGEPCEDAPVPASAYRIVPDGNGWPTLVEEDPFDEFALFRKGAEQWPLVRTDPMGGALGDLDGDGLPDFVLSLNPNHETFAGSTGDKLVTVSGRPSYLQIHGERNLEIPWGAAVVDLDLDGRPDVVFAHGNDPRASRYPQFAPGEQTVSFHLNQGGFVFEDVTEAVGLPRSQWRSLVLDDLDCDGDADLAVGAQDDWPRIYRNDTPNDGHALSLRLKGTTSNPLGIGAKVEIWTEEATQPQAHWAGSMAAPLAWSRPTVFAGLAGATLASLVRVTWPSGLVQEVRALEGGRCHVIEEPQTIAIEPASRHAAAGTSMKIIVTPRAPDGTPRKAAVDVRVKFGSASVTLAQRAEGTVATVVRETPGQAVLEVSIDGTSLWVRPRLWWD